jgi:UDP-N-acetylmuramate--alanine ligase
LIALNTIRSVFFVGIGGIGMSALARYFHARGVTVSGYDRTSTDLTKELEASGIIITYNDEVGMPAPTPDLVVFTPAIPSDSVLLNHFRATTIPVLKRSDVLEIVSAGSFNICVAGTHGKTTITTMIAHLLRASGYGCNAFLGGISVNYDTNFWSDPKNVCVIEADEYDRSFLKLSPDVAIISAMDADHLDIYGNETALQDAFIAFSGKVKKGGLLLNKFGLDRARELSADRHLTYSLQNERANVHAVNIVIKDGSYHFDVLLPDDVIEGLTLNMGGMHNVENAVAAVGVAASLGIEPSAIRSSLESFRGVKRRFEYIVKRQAFAYIDDYAHHPEELKALLTGARTLFRQRKLTLVFQPHLFSRTRDFAAGFAESLDLADEVVLLPIYPARELPIEGVTSEMIAEKMTRAKVTVMTAAQTLDWAEKKYVPSLNLEFGDVVITAGAGDIDKLIVPLKSILNK